MVQKSLLGDKRIHCISENTKDIIYVTPCKGSGSTCSCMELHRDTEIVTLSYRNVGPFLYLIVTPCKNNLNGTVAPLL